MVLIERRSVAAGKVGDPVAARRGIRLLGIIDRNRRRAEFFQVVLQPKLENGLDAMSTLN